jgi:sporulation protein YlmC with PRC-barrel domain
MNPNPERTGERLVAAARVEGTEVFNTEGQHLGEVKDVFIDKVSGRAEFATLAFGGVLGVGEKRHPIPWKALTYDPEQNGFVIDLDKEVLRAAPSYDDALIYRPDHPWGDEVRGYYAERSLGIL